MITCPTCGEADRISGAPLGDGIQITCGSCQTVWMRGEAHCKQCGATGGIPTRQVMTRTPRGNQLAVVGHRETLLCPTCDADAIRASASDPVPQDYVSVFLFGSELPPRPTQATHHETSGRAVAPPHPTLKPATDGPVSERQEPEIAEGAALPPSLADPTARQAIEAYLETSPGADSLAMLMLGRHLGPSRRVRDLNSPVERDRLRAWIAETWPTRDPHRRDEVRAAIFAALTHWRDQGWIDHDALESLD